MAGKAATQEVPEVVERALGEGAFSVEKFVESFPALVEAAGGTRKMRELAIELATRGLFNEDRIDVEWRSLTLADVVSDFQNGISKRRGEAGSPVPVLRLADIDTGTRLRSDDLREITLTKAEQEKYKVDQGDVLVIRVNGSADLVGRFVPCEVKRNWAYSDHLIRLRLRHAMVDTRFLCTAARSVSARTHITSKTVSTAGQRTINQTGLGTLPLSLPALAEQKRIVARVDQLMALIDQLEAKQNRKRDLGARFTKASLEALTTTESPQSLTTAWTRLQSNWPTILDHSDKARELRRAIIALALRGRLTNQIAAEGTTDQLLERLIRQGLSGRRQEMEAFPEIPSSWAWVALGGLVTFGPKNGYSPKAVERPTKVKSLTLSATTSGSFDGNHFKYIDEDVPADSDLWLSEGDILVQRGNTIDYVGMAAVFHGPKHTFIYPDLMMRIRVAPELDLDFIHLALNGPTAREFITSRASGTSGSMPKINQTVLLDIPIPLPPIAEQRRITARVQSLMKLCDALEAALRRREDRAAKLAEAVVQEMVA